MEQEKGLLEGVVVLDLTRVLAGPYCGALMADMGATVIKVEQPGKGDDSRSMGPFVNDQSVYYANFNRSKMGVTLNLKDPEAKEIFKEMVKKADVVIENYRPGTMEKLGLGYDVLKEINPGIIYGACSGFGHTGPYSKRAGYDIVGQAMGGAMVAVCAAEYGMKRFDLIRTAFRYSVVTSVLMTAALSVLLALAAGPLSSVFTMSDDLAYLHGDMTEMLMIFALFLPVMSLVYTGSSLMQSINRATGGMINSLARNIILSAGMYAAMVAFGTLTSLWWATAIAEILGGLMMFAHARIVLRRVEREESDADPQAGAE